MGVITFEKVSKLYNGKATVEDFSLRIAPGERLVILGPSGCGKTTVLNMLAGFIVPDRGKVMINGELAASNGQILREPEERNLGMVFQDLALWPHLSVRGNLEFGLQGKGVKVEERAQRIENALRLVGMENYMDAKPGQLSGGERQRIAIARSLVLHPRILLMDEPLSSLDYELNFLLRKEIIALHEQLGFTLVYVTHNLEEAFDIATRVVVMKHGKIERTGLPDEMREHFSELSRKKPLPARKRIMMAEDEKTGAVANSPDIPSVVSDGPGKPQSTEFFLAQEFQEDQLPSWRKVFSYFFLLGFINIGGPVAQITMMFNHMVEKQRWLTKDRFTKIMAFCHMLPGPEALQLAIYVGYLKRGIVGGTLAGATFIIPGAALMILLSYLYVTYGSLPQVNDILFILKPAVLGIIAAGIIKLGRAAVKNVFLGCVVIGAIFAMVVAKMNFLFVLILASFINLVYAEFAAKLRGPSKLLAISPIAWGGFKVGLWSGANAGWLQIAWLFLKTGALSFGGAYASLIFMQHGAVEQYHWLTDGQLLDGVALSVATPGPFMLFTTFVGYLAAGVPGAVLATFFVFLPSFVFVIAGARYVELVRSNRYIQAFLAGGSAAVVGIIAVVSLKLIPDALAAGVPSYVITGLAFLAITWRKIDVALIAIAAMVVGIGYAILHYVY